MNINSPTFGLESNNEDERTILGLLFVKLGEVKKDFHENTKIDWLVEKLKDSETVVPTILSRAAGGSNSAGKTAVLQNSNIDPNETMELSVLQTQAVRAVMFQSGQEHNDLVTYEANVTELTYIVDAAIEKAGFTIKLFNEVMGTKYSSLDECLPSELIEFIESFNKDGFSFAGKLQDSLAPLRARFFELSRQYLAPSLQVQTMPAVVVPADPAPSQTESPNKPADLSTADAQQAFRLPGLLKPQVLPGVAEYVDRLEAPVTLSENEKAARVVEQIQAAFAILLSGNKSQGYQSLLELRNSILLIDRTNIDQDNGNSLFRLNKFIGVLELVVKAFGNNIESATDLQPLLVELVRSNNLEHLLTVTAVPAGLLDNYAEPLSLPSGEEKPEAMTTRNPSRVITQTATTVNSDEELVPFDQAKT